jgi:cyclic pyranopterin phosphate synthase
MNRTKTNTLNTTEHLKEPIGRVIIAAQVSDMKLSHLDEEGRARMVDVGKKPDTRREAVARGRIVMHPPTLALIQEGGLPKGDVLATAQIAGVMAAKRTHELIPMCHPLLLTHIDLEFEPHTPDEDEDSAAIEITATVRTTGKTGVEMEALTAVTIAGLTIYDMCKAVDRGMRIEAVRLIRKQGGKSGMWIGD